MHIFPPPPPVFMRPQVDKPDHTHYIAKGDFELLILLLFLPKGWDYKHVPSQLVYDMLGINPSALFMVDKPCPN